MRGVATSMLFASLLAVAGRDEVMSRMTFWVVRHAEREDNISSAWRKTSKLKSDNSPLSKRGQGSFLPGMLE